MIKVVYYRSSNKITIDGHALSGESGHDLVCAAASILTYTLANTVDNMVAAKQCKDKRILLESGHAVIVCRPLSRYASVVKLLLDTICSGFEILAKNYPQNILYEIHG